MCFVGLTHGQGVYFSVSAQDATSYAQPDTRGLYQMYYTRVLTGQHTKGNQQMKTPPPKNEPDNESLSYYDSTTDRLDDPSIYVIYYDTQAYPEYIVTFK